MPVKEIRRLLLFSSKPETANELDHIFNARRRKAEVITVTTRRDLSRAISKNQEDIVILYQWSLRYDLAKLLSEIHQHGTDIPIIVIAKSLPESATLKAFNDGASDCLDSDHLGRLPPIVEREYRGRRNRNEHKQAINTWREEEARFRSMALHTPGLIFRFSLKKPHSLVFSYASDAAQMLLGLTPQVLIDRPGAFDELLLKEDKQSFMAALNETSAAGQRLNWEGRILAEQNDIKWINVRGTARELDSNQLIWEGVMWNITHSKLVEEELRISRAQLADLSSHLQNVKEDERERIARDVHDVLGGHLVAMKFEIAQLANNLQPGNKKGRQGVDALTRLVDEGIETVGRVTRELRPGILRDFGLTAAIESQSEDFRRRTGIQCKIRCDDIELDMPEATSIAIFRIFQEALTNISKHAQASFVEIDFSLRDSEVILRIADNGVGIVKKDLNKPKSFGLRGMRERINGLDGHFEIGSGVNGGTVLVLCVPLKLKQLHDFTTS